MRLRVTRSAPYSWPLRAIRGARPDRNPLRRGIDRLETCLLVGLFLVMAVVTPLAAPLAGHASYQSALQARQQQLLDRHQVRAVLTQGAGPVDGYSLSPFVLASADWTSFTGAHRSGEVPAVPGSAKGTAVAIWTDSNGYLDGPPLELSEVASQADTAMIGTVVASVVAYLVAATAVRQLFNRRRMAAWDADWAVTAPTWKRQRG
ncbi:MAG: Rv1733c family protein [Trebonia sp.]